MTTLETETTRPHTSEPEIPSANSAAELPHITIQPSRGWRLINWREIWEYRDLLFTLANRDVKLRYRQTALGPVWLLLGPLLSAGLFSFVFGKIANLPTDGYPYIVFILPAQLAWSLFSGIVGKAGGSLVGNIGLVSKIYFPRLILPLNGIFGTLLDFAVGLIPLTAFMAYFRIVPHWGLVLLPVWLAILILFALGIGLYSGAANVRYRDAGGFIAPLLTTLQWLSPINYSVAAVAGKVPHSFLPYYYLNPFASLMQAVRWSVLGAPPPPWIYVGYSALLGIVLFFVGALYFRRAEREFADVI